MNNLDKPVHAATPGTTATARALSIGQLGKKELSAELVTITPDMAEKWVNTQISNRALSNYHTGWLEGELQRGEWVINGDAIRFNEKGHLIDGQHRLIACLRAQIPFTTFVIYGLPENAFVTIDTGKPRNLGQVLELSGEKYTSQLAHMLRIIWHYHMHGEKMLLVREKPSNQQLLQILDYNPGVRDGFNFCERIGVNKIMPLSTAALIHYVTSQADKQKAKVFIEEVAYGTKLEDGFAPHALRIKIQSMKKSGAHVSYVHRYAWAMIAWNAFLNGQKIYPEEIQWRRTKTQTDPMPLFDGVDRWKFGPFKKEDEIQRLNLT